MLFTDSMSLGDKLLNGLGVTILGMGVVFTVLVILSFALDLLRISVGENNKKKAIPREEVVKTEKITNIKDNTQQNDEEIIAVISAAIASLSGDSIEEFFIKSIKPIPQKNNIWAAIGRQERMLDRL